VRGRIEFGGDRTELLAHAMGDALPVRAESAWGWISRIEFGVDVVRAPGR
jgi:hypothetical protein